MSEEISTGKSQIASMVEDINTYRFSPHAVQRVVLGYLRDLTDGKVDVVDPTSPFVYALESSAVNTAAFMMQNETLNRKQYPEAAQSFEELYMHMSDKDHVDCFATPARGTFRVAIAKHELLAKMELDPSTGIRKVTMPRNTEFHVSDTTFSLQYPIEIKQLTHGGLQVTYDTDVISPLQELPSNSVKWWLTTPAHSQVEMLMLEVDAYQFSILSLTGDLLQSTGYNKIHAFEDKFYHCRVYYKNSHSNDLWREILTTHTEEVYDPQAPTAALQIVNNTVRVKIPTIYTSGVLSTGSLRIDIYTTKGEVSMNLNSMRPSDYSATWRAIDAIDVTPEVAAFRAIESIFAYSVSNINGGKNAIGLEELRERVIQNTTGPQQLPITNVQIETALQNQGFTIVKNVDVITNRNFLATKPLPKPVDEKLITPASASIESFIASMDKLKSHSLVRDNGERITLTPDLVYENKNGIINLLSLADISSILALNPEEQAMAVNAANYLYSPFHYVLDAAKQTFSIRPYYLDSPVIEGLAFVDHNDTTGCQVNSGEFSIEKLNNGYRVLVKTISNDFYRSLPDSVLHTQMSFVGKNETVRTFINGQLIGRDMESNEPVFMFELLSNFDVDEKDNLLLTNFMGTSTQSMTASTPLTNGFEITYSTSATMDQNWVPTTDDAELGRFLLPNQIAFITKERMTVTLGKSMNNMWASARSLPGASPYKTYAVDVPAFYQEDVYEVDPDTGEKFTFDASGRLQYKILHNAGEPMLNANGDPVLQYKKGDIMFDPLGNPIPTSPLELVRQMDIMFIEGVYHFATDIAAQRYRQLIVDTVVTWVTQDLEVLNARLLEQSHIYYYPKTTMGKIRAVVENAVLTTIEARQSFRVKLYVSKVVYEKPDLRAELTRSTIAKIDELLNRSTVSISNISSVLGTMYQNDVIALDMSNFGGEPGYNMLTIYEEGERCSIKKKLVAQGDGKLIVEEDVNVDFVQHSTD